MEEQIKEIKSWLGVGAINIFGIQFSGKDTVGRSLSEILDAEFVVSGDIVRANAERLANESNSDQGLLAPTKEYIEVVQEYLKYQTSPDRALILSSLGRWIGEEQPIMSALDEGGHKTKAVMCLNITEDEVWRRWNSAGTDRNGGRVDDLDSDRVARRIDEFKNKTLPVIEVYRKLGLLIEINGEQPREKVLSDVIAKLYEFSLNN